jgi:hypothetical protein
MQNKDLIKCIYHNLRYLIKGYILKKLTLKSFSIGSLNIIYKKFSVYDFFLSGCTIGNPLLVLNEIAARVGILAINLIADSSLYFGSLISNDS